MEDMVRYIDEIVEPTIKDFEKNPTSVRHGFLACVAAIHATDYWHIRKNAPLLSGNNFAKPHLHVQS